ncbi:glycosyl transferase group 1 [Halteromyces radiatus]|uniref:glycosyl transferase group 1 n=1 Tax=Halteromyces radiatus TaxID=101107 RepID=UPI00221F9821|nr:glycosyl transferase group 1 [Halteromyces radiatus]KAI8086476.1 glycosyl transferase group 1 [Halteromyces radiatus]
MRIAIVTENWLPKVDGVTRTLSRLLEHLQANGHNVLLLGPESGMTEFAGAEILGTYGIPFLPYPELKLNLWRPAFTERLLSFAPQVIHIVDPVWLGPAALFMIQRYLPNTPIVSSYHTNLATYCHHFGWGWFTPLMWRWNQFCHSQCLYTACPSPSTKRMLELHGFDHVRLWPRGVDMDLFSPLHRSLELREQWMGLSSLMDDNKKKNQDKCVLLYVGRISFEKNIGLLLDAYKEMDHSKCHLVCVGHGPAFDDIQQQYCINKSNQDGDSVLPITFTGYLQGTDLATAYASADMFVFPSTTETFGQVVLEAMASGLPVVGLQAEGICDLVEDEYSGLLLDGDDVTGYKNNMERLVNRPLERQHMGKNALMASKSYTWPAAMNQMVQVYKDAIGDSKISDDRINDVVSTVDRLDDSDSGVEEDYLLMK